MSKPGDFLLGVQDFFAVLLPGAIATLLLAEYLPGDLAHFLRLAGEVHNDPVTHWAVFLLTSYTLGHFVFAIGSKLDGPYDSWRRRAKPLTSDRVYQAADDLRKKLTPTLADADNGFTTLKWAKSYIQIHSSQARIEIDRHEATSKFFRGLVVISVALTVHFLVHRRPLGLVLGSIVIGIMSFQRFCDQRWKMTELCYATAVILHDTKLKHFKKPTDSQKGEDEKDADEEDEPDGDEAGP